eukprot:5659100-Pleurochrysis_carterae.AAC.1
MHEFLLRKDRNNVVRTFFRKSSQSSTWLPEGEGYEAFKSLPTGTPELAAFRKDVSWERQLVSGTVCQWQQHWTIPREADRKLATAEWQRRLW